MAKARRTRGDGVPMGSHTIIITVPAGSHLTAVARKTSAREPFARKVKLKTDADPRKIHVGRVSAGASSKRGAKSSSRKKGSAKRGGAKASTRGMATRSKHDGGVSKRRAVNAGIMAARMGRTIHTSKARRPAGYTKADAIVAQRAAASERARLGKSKRKRRR